MKKSKSQAAMEFLMTYGWAILVVIIVIAILAWLGIFSPSRYLSDTCMINAPLGCKEASVTSSQIKLNVVNNVGEDITLNTLTFSDEAVGYTVSNPDLGAGTVTISEGGTRTITFTPGAGITSMPKGRMRSNIVVTYTKVSGTLTQTASGTLTATVR